MKTMIRAMGENFSERQKLKAKLVSRLGDKYSGSDSSHMPRRLKDHESSGDFFPPDASEKSGSHGQRCLINKMMGQINKQSYDEISQKLMRVM